MKLTALTSLVALAGVASVSARAPAVAESAHSRGRMLKPSPVDHDSWAGFPDAEVIMRDAAQGF